MTRGVKQSYSVMGYRNDSPDKNNKTNTIAGENISMDNVDHPVMAYPQKGQPTLMYPGNNYQFPGSDYVHELPIKQTGGLTKNQMLSKIHQEFMYGNPSALRMMAYNTPSYLFKGNEKKPSWQDDEMPKTGEKGTHFMASMDNYAVPLIQQTPNGEMYYKSKANPSDKEAMKFNNEQDAAYFAEHYKEVAPMMQQFNKQFGGNLNQNNMAKKGFSIPGYKYGGNKLGGVTIVPDNNAYGQSTAPMPVEYQRAMNGMMQMGGNYLDYTSLNPTLAGMQYGGGTRDYAPVNQNNASIEFVNDKRGYNNMQTPGQHYTNEGFKKSTGSTNNGASFSKYGGPQFQQFMPTPNEYAYLANGGFIDNTSDEMKYGGIHINSRPFYRNGGIVEGEYDIDNDLTSEEIKHLKSMGYNVINL